VYVFALTLTLGWIATHAIGIPHHAVPITRTSATASRADDGNDLRDPQERHLADIRQLTFGGQNAEAYFSPDGKQLIFQSQREGHECDQQYVMDIDGKNVHLVSTGTGRTT